METKRLMFALALASGILGANPFADAAGLPQVDMERPGGTFALVVRVLCAGVLYVLTLGLTRILIRQGERTAAALRRVPERPALAVTIALLACGTLCVLGAVALAWRGESITVEFNRGMLPETPGLRMMGGRAGGSLDSIIRLIVTFGALGIGGSLLFLGVWSGLNPAPPAPGKPAPTREIATD